MLIVGEEEETAPFLSVATDRKEGNISVTIEEFAEIVDAEIKRH
jgi:threonyl-tRNA synthetase